MNSIGVFDLADLATYLGVTWNRSNVIPVLSNKAIIFLTANWHSIISHQDTGIAMTDKISAKDDIFCGKVIFQSNLATMNYPLTIPKFAELGEFALDKNYNPLYNFSSQITQRGVEISGIFSYIGFLEYGAGSHQVSYEGWLIKKQ